MIEDIRRKGSLNEGQKEVVHILKSYIASLRSLKGDDKMASSRRKDKDDEDREKKVDPKKKEKKGNKGDDDKKDLEQGNEKV